MTAIENDLDALDPTRLERLDSVPQDDPWYDDPEDEGFQMSDVEADADTLASAGWGTDEDYGYFGEDN